MAKPRANIYTVMLALALVAVLIGCLLLLLEYRRYSSIKGERAWQVATVDPSADCSATNQGDSLA